MKLGDRRGSASTRGYDRVWRRLSEAVRSTEPYCRMCAERGIVRPAQLVDHIVPVEIAPDKRLDQGNLQPLCRICHGVKTAEDLARYHSGGDLPAELLWPSWLKPALGPLIIVCGPPASGKSTYVDEHRQPSDVVIDLDLIAEERGVGRWRGPEHLPRLLAGRNKRLALLSETPSPAWFVVGAPNPDERDKWARQLKPREVIVLLTPYEDCLARLKADPGRPPAQHRALNRWWQRYSARTGDTVIGDGYCPPEIRAADGAQRRESRVKMMKPRIKAKDMRRVVVRF